MYVSIIIIFFYCYYYCTFCSILLQFHYFILLGCPTWPVNFVFIFWGNGKRVICSWEECFFCVLSNQWPVHLLKWRTKVFLELWWCRTNCFHGNHASGLCSYVHLPILIKIDSPGLQFKSLGPGEWSPKDFFPWLVV